MDLHVSYRKISLLWNMIIRRSSTAHTSICDSVGNAIDKLAEQCEQFLSKSNCKRGKGISSDIDAETTFPKKLQTGSRGFTTSDPAVHSIH